MGEVYRARDRETGKDVAVKLIAGGDHENLPRFAREVQILASLSHPAIVRYVAHGVTPDGNPYLVMDWVEGETLHDRLERAGLTIAETLQLGQRLADALAYAHGLGVIHRDLKPGNLILPAHDLSRISLLDFGIARTPTAGSLTETGALVGTPAYMAPEQARGERGLGPAVDVFALGCILYECLTGRRAFEGKHVLALIAKVVLWEPPPPRSLDPEVPVELDDAITKMITKEAAQRPRDGAAVAALLAGITAPGTGPRGRPAAPKARAATAPTISTPSPEKGGARLASIVVATHPPPEDESAPAAEPAHLADGTLLEAVRKIEPFSQVLHDGSILAVVTGEVTPQKLVERAVRCARALRGAVPEALIAVATGEIGDGDPMAATIDTLLEDTVGALSREAMAMLFAAAARPADAIRIDERTAALVPAEVVIRVKSAYYVRGERA
jgi:hypothetical protein